MRKGPDKSPDWGLSICNNNNNNNRLAFFKTKNVSQKIPTSPTKRVRQAFHCFCVLVYAAITHSQEQVTQTPVIKITFIIIYKNKKEAEMVGDFGGVFQIISIAKFSRN